MQCFNCVAKICVKHMVHAATTSIMQFLSYLVEVATQEMSSKLCCDVALDIFVCTWWEALD